jgi:hypothetical protein
MMKASENPYVKKYIDEVCYPIAYAEVKLGKIIGEDEHPNQFDGMELNPLHTRTLVRLDRTVETHRPEEIVLDTHSKGRADRHYENRHTGEFDRIGYKVLNNNEFIPKIIEALDNSNLDCTNVNLIENIGSPNRSATWGTLVLKNHPINIELPNGNSATQYPTIDWTNSYDKTFCARLWAGLYGGICLNRQVFAGWAIMQYTHRHIKRKDGSSGVDMDVIQSKIDGLQGTFETITKQCKEWASTPLTEAHARGILSKTLAWNAQTRQANEKKLEELMNWFLLYETKSSGMNLWSLYNTATRYATHGLTHDTGRVFSASQLQKLQQTVLFMIQSPTWKSHSQNRYLNPSLA